MNSSSKINSKDLMFFDRFQITQKDCKTGDIVIKDRDTGQSIIIQQIIISKQQDSSAILKQLKNRKNLSHQWLLPMLHYYIRKSIFNDSQRILIFSKHAQNNLEIQYKVRKKEKRTFAQVQIWQLLFCILCVACYLIQQGVIFSIFRLIDFGIHQRSFSVGIPKIETSVKNLNVILKYFYSPQEFSEMKKIYCLKSQESNNQHSFQFEKQNNFEKRAVFSLGMCMIKLMLLKSCQNIYYYTNMTVKQQTLHQLVQLVQKRYSSVLSKIIRQMVELQPQQRPEFSQIKEFVANYMDSIDLLSEKNKKNTQTRSTKAAYSQPSLSQRQAKFHSKSKKQYNLHVNLEQSYLFQNHFRGKNGKQKLKSIKERVLRTQRDNSTSRIMNISTNQCSSGSQHQLFSRIMCKSTKAAKQGELKSNVSFLGLSKIQKGTHCPKYQHYQCSLMKKPKSSRNYTPNSIRNNDQSYTSAKLIQMLRMDTSQILTKREYIQNRMDKKSQNRTN